MIKRILSMILTAMLIVQAFCLTASADSASLNSDMSALTQDSLLYVPLQQSGNLLVDNLNLPKTGANGSTISWSAEPENIIDSEGKLTRPDVDTEVELTATLTNGSDTDVKSFTFMVAGKDNSVNGLPKLKNSIYYDDFEDGIADANHVDIPATSNRVTEENGALHFVRGTSGNAEASIYLNEDQSLVTGQFVTEYIFTRNYGNWDQKGMLSSQFVGQALVGIVTWSTPYNNDLSMMSATTLGGARVYNPARSVIKGSPLNALNKLKVTVYYDTDAKLMRFWMNNVYMGEGYFCGSASDMQRIYFYNSSTETDIRLEEFHFYEAEFQMSDAMCVEADTVALSQDSFYKMPLVENTYLMESLQLPTEGENGTTISWASSPSGVISSTGWLTRPASDTVVTLTATVTKNAASKERIFTFNVPGRSTNVGGLPLVDEVQAYDNFDDNTPGSLVELTPGEGTATESNGKIELKKTGRSGTTQAELYLKEDKTAVKGQFVVEFTLNRKTNTSPTFTSICVNGDDVGSGTQATHLTWWNTSKNMDLTYAATSGGQGVVDSNTLLTDIDAASRLKVLLYFDTNTGRVLFWLNNKYITKGFMTGADGVSSICIYNDDSIFDTTIDDFRYYTSSLPGSASQNVTEDLEALTDTSLLKAPMANGKIADSLNLPVLGPNGSDIIWQSDKPNVIAENGTVIRQLEDTQVTLTATASYLGENEEEKEFTFTVAGLNAGIGNMPKLTSLAYMDDFNDGVVDANRFVLSDGNGSATESGGTLNLVKPAATGTTSAMVYLKEDRSAFSDTILVEFLMSRKAVQVMSAQMSGTNGLYGIIDWWAPSTGVNIQYANEKGGARASHIVLANDNSVRDNIKVSVLFSPKFGTFSVWLNNVLYAEDAWSTGGKDISQIYFYNGSSVCDASIDDFRIYYVQEDDEKAVNMDLANLESFFTPGELTPGLLYKSVSLPTVGNHGSTISWNSDNTALVDNNGTVTRPTGSVDGEVTFTATVTCGNVSKEKVLTYKVLRDGTGDMVVAEKDAQALVLENLLETAEPINSYISQDLNLPTAGQYGSTISWESSDDTLVSDSGAILSVPDTAENSPEITLTATVAYLTAEVTREIRFRILPSEVETLRQALPELDEMIYEEDFSDDSMSATHWFLRPYGGYTQVNGKMELTRNTVHDIYAYAIIYGHESKTAQEGLLAFDFTWEKVDQDKEGYIELEGTADGLLSALTWQADGTIVATYANRKGGGAVSENLGSYSGEVRVTGMVNSDTDTWTLWLNEEIVLKDKYPASCAEAGFLAFEMRLTDRNFTTMYVDDFSLYRAKPYVYEQASMDANKLTDSDIVTGGFPFEKTIDSDLTLPSVGFYGSEITWESSDPSLVDPDTGQVFRPENVSENPRVTLTATVRSGDYVALKEFTYYVLTAFSSDRQYVEADLEYLTFENYGMYSFDDTSMDNIRYSLKLPDDLVYSSEVMWSTSDTSVLTSSGRVSRPTWNQPAKTVTLTATLTYGSYTGSKDFTVVIQPDEELTDPNYQTDDEFFGAWNGTTWTKQPAFNYEANPKMAAVEAAAKAGDYELAKEELLAYMQSRPASPLGNSSAARNTKYVDQMVMPGVWHYQSDRFFMGSTQVRSHEYEEIRIPIRTDLLAEGKNSFNIASKYHENSSVSIISKDHPDSSMHPKLEVTVEGSTLVYDAIADATIRGGQYDYTNFGYEDTLHVKMFGEFQGDGYESAVFCFDAAGLPSGTRNSVYLVVYAKVDQNYVETKELLVHEEPSISWDESKVTYGSLPKYYYNVNGIPGQMDWLRAYPKYGSSEFHQTHRFQNISQVLAEYEYTQDEKYAYKMIYTMMDYIIDSQYEMSLNDWRSAQGGYKWSDYDELEKMSNGGATPGYMRVTCGMPQMLSTAFRLVVWTPMFERLMHSEYMTPDVCTTILKNFWGVVDWGDYYLTNYALQQPKQSHNQWVHEAMSLSQVVLCYPEFAESETWLDTMLQVLAHVKEGGYAEDGAYGETANGYSIGVLNQFIDYVILMEKAGRELPDGFADFLYNAVIYNETIQRDPAGIAMSWGDSGWAKSFSRPIPNYEQLSNDPTYLFLDTRGTEGAAPDWTSIHFPSLRVTSMRSDWTTNALHSFIDNNGVGGHGHADDNAMRVTAYGEYLLTDPGMFSYDDNIYRRYGLSTRAHNTVEVDDASQNHAVDGLFDTSQADTLLWGETHEWNTNKQFDVLSQTSKSYQKSDSSPAEYPEVDHRRTITFLKSGFWIVSDLMQPKDGRAHDYKQLWHMMPDAYMTIDYRNGQIKSNKSGANIIMSSPSGQVTHSPAHDPADPKQNDGWFTRRWGMYEYAPYGYYALEDVAGNAGIDTLVFPYATQGQGSAETEAINLGVDADVATAMKMTTTMDGQTSKTHYMLEYEPTKGTTRTFGEFAGDGMVNVVRTDEDGNIQELILNKGTVLKRADGSTILEVSSNDAVNVGIEIRGTTAVVTTSGSISTGEATVNPEDVSFYASGNIDNVLFNDAYYEFTQDENGVISVEADTTDEVLDNDSSNNNGGIISGGSEGSGGGGSDKPEQPGGTDKPDEPEQPGGNVPSAIFNDVAGHWAEDSINSMAAQGIVQGDNGKFRPDASITRAELITMVVRALNLSEKGTQTGFSDVAEDSWYASYIKAALDNGIISKDTHFRPNDVVTREEMAKILAGANAIMKGETLVLPEGDTSFTDAHTISMWAQPYVLYASENGLMNGVGEGNFAPKATGTRAQVATVLDRMFTQKK